MNPDGKQARLARLKRECDVSAAPAILLGVACSVFVLRLAVSTVTDETPPTQACQPLQQVNPSAGRKCSHPLGLTASADSIGRLKAEAGPVQANGVGWGEPLTHASASVNRRSHACISGESSSLGVQSAFHAGHLERARVQGRWNGQPFNGPDPNFTVLVKSRHYVRLFKQEVSLDEGTAGV
jgi:hypothetical protein